MHRALGVPVQPGMMLAQAASALSCQAPVVSSAQHQQTCHYGSKDASDNKEASSRRSGSRLGVKLKDKDPQALERMKVLLGYYDVPGIVTQTAPRINSVTISLLQTLKFLDMPQQLKDRLMIYKTLSLNREMEQAHAHTMKFLASFEKPATKGVSRPAGLSRLQQM